MCKRFLSFEEFLHVNEEFKLHTIYYHPAGILSSLLSMQTKQQRETAQIVYHSNLIHNVFFFIVIYLKIMRIICFSTFL
jgi:hypothetical protein